MAENSYLQSIEKARRFVQDHYKDWESIDRKILEISKNAQKLTTLNADGSIKELNSRIEKNVTYRKQMNEQVKKQEKVIKTLRAEVNKLNKAQKQVNATETKNDKLSKKMTANMLSSVNAIGKTSAGIKKLNTYYTQLQKNTDKSAKGQKRASELAARAAEKEAQATRKITQAKAKKQQKTTEEIENNKILARNARSYAKINSKLTDTYEKQSLELNQLRKAYKNLAIRRESGVKLSKKETLEMKRLEKQVHKLDSRLKKVDASAGQFQRSVGNYGKALGGLRNLASAAGFMGGGFLAVSVFRDGIRRVREFDKEMQNMAGIMRVTRDDIQDLEAEIIRISAASIKTSNEVALLSSNLITLGKTKDEVKQLLGPVVDLGIGLQTTSENAGEFLVQTLNAFEAGTESAEKFADVIATIRTSTSLDFQRMRDSFQYMSPIANALGEDLAWVGSVVGILSDSGLKAEQAGRVLSTALQRLAKDSLTLGDALEIIVEMTDNGATRMEVMAKATKLFGVQAAKTAVVLARNTQEIDNNAEAVRNSTGALDDLVGEQLKSLDARIKILDATYEELIFTIDNGTGKTSSFFKGIIDGAAAVISAITQLVTTTSQSIDKGRAAAEKDFTKIMKSNMEEYGDTVKETAEVILPSFINVLADAESKLARLTAEKRDRSDLGFPFNLLPEMFLNDEINQITEMTEKYRTLVRLAKNAAGQNGGSAIFGPVQNNNEDGGNEDFIGGLLAEQDALDGVNEKRTEYNDILKQISEQRKALGESTEEEAGAILDSIDVLEAKAEAWKRNNKEVAKAIELQREIVESVSTVNDVQENSVDYHERIISALQKEQSRVSRTSKEWDFFTESIKRHADAVKIIQDVKGFAADELEMPDEEIEAFNKAITEKLTFDGITGGLKRLSEITGEEVGSLTEDFTAIYGEDNLYKADFDNFLEFSEAKISQKEKESEKIEELQEEIIAASIGLVGDLFEAEIEKIDQRIEKNKDYYAKLLANENLTEERRSALEAERDLKERKLLKEKKKRQNEQFLFEKGIALAKAGINIAEAITEALPNPFLTALTAVLGAVQIASIVAQSVPKFEKGTESAPAGWAIVDEVRPEVHADKHDNVKSFGSDKGSNMRFLEQGDKVYKSHQDYAKKQGSQGIEDTIWDLNMQYQGRPVPENNGNLAMLGKMGELISAQDKLGKRMERLASRPINNNLTVEVPDNRAY